MFRRVITELSVEDVEKRRLPGKHYVYVIYVTWNDGSLNIIYRRYSRFFELQTKLLDKFPEDAGMKDPKRRIIPFLPGKILFGRSHIREVALKRLQAINQYCKALIKLPDRISQCDEVFVFFETSPDDLLQHAKTIERRPSKPKAQEISQPMLLDQYMAVADYVKQGRNELSLQSGQKVEVVEKTQLGWWFVSTEEGQGWVPSSHLEKEDGSQEDRVVHEADPGEEERYVVVDTYIPMAADEIRIDKGGFVQVLERNLDGWWLVRYHGNEGRVPATNLIQADTLRLPRAGGGAVTASPNVQVIPNLMSISNINKKRIEQLVSPPASASSSSTEASARSTPLPPPPAAAASLATRTVKLIDLSPEEESGGGRDGEGRSLLQEASTEFNPQLRASRRKVPPPRRNSLSVVAPPRPVPPQVEAVYVAVADLEVSTEDGVSLERGQVLSVLEKTDTGWWYVSAGGSRGWAPVSYITKRHQAKKSQSSSPKPPRPPAPGPKKPGTSQMGAANDTARSLAAVLKTKVSQNKSPPLTPPLQDSPVTGPSRNSPEAFQLQLSEPEAGQLYQNVADETEVTRYVAAYDYEGLEVGEVPLTAGDVVDVLGRNASGWWYVCVLTSRRQVAEGWVPSSYLKPCPVQDGAVADKTASERLYEEVRVEDDDDASWSTWSDSGSSVAPSVVASPTPPAAVYTTTGQSPKHGPLGSGDASDSPKVPSSPSSRSPPPPASPTRATHNTDAFQDVERLNNYVKSTLKGPKPVLPLKKSKDAENSHQRQMALLSESETGSSTESETSQAKVLPRPPTVNRSNSAATKKELPRLPVKKSAREQPLNQGTKPAVPTSKPGMANKPLLPNTKPGVNTNKPTPPGTKPVAFSTKPSIPANKPQAVSTGTSKPAIKAGKPVVRSTKPLPAKDKPNQDTFRSLTSKHSQQQTWNQRHGEGVKIAWPPGETTRQPDNQRQEERETGGSSSSSHPPAPGVLSSSSSSSSTSASSKASSKVQDLAKLFGQT